MMGAAVGPVMPATNVGAVVVGVPTRGGRVGGGAIPTRPVVSGA